MALFVTIAGMVLACSAAFAGAFQRYVPVTLISDRTGLVMETGAKVKLRGVEVGRVGGIIGGSHPVGLKLEMFPDQLGAIPANVGAEIKATTAFGAKYVDLIYPEDPSPKRLVAGEVLRSRNVGTEVNTVFDNLVGLLRQVDVPKLNAVLTALADGVRGQGERMGEATTAANEVLLAINPRMDTMAANWRSFKGFSDAYSAAADDILATLDAASTTSTTVTDHAKELETVLLNTIGFSRSGIGLLGPNKDNFVTSINVLEPTTSLLLEYSPEYTCVVQGANIYVETSNKTMGGNGRSTILDSGLSFGDEMYKYPDNLPVVAAKGGYGGKAGGCGSLPDVSKNMPFRQLVTNTGWGTGTDWRPNPGIGNQCWVDYFRVTRTTPLPPAVRECLPGPAVGPEPYPGAPAYGAPWYGPEGTPLFPGVPPAPGPPPSPSAP